MLERLKPSLGMEMEEYELRIERGKGSAQYRRDILNEWADPAPGEFTIPNHMHDAYRSHYEAEPDSPTLVALIGSYLLDGQIPPFLAEHFRN